MERIVEFAHNLLLKKVKKDDICVDMTAGNGKDTLFLCNLSKFVYAFDIQQIALDNTKMFLEKNNVSNYQLILSSHEHIDLYVKEKVKAFIYNLGYLPTGDKNITTMANSTILSIKKALNLLDDKGLLVLVVYPGHETGSIESELVYNFMSLLPQKDYEIITYKFINQINNPPYVIALERR